MILLKVPLQLYDFISVIFPAMILLFFLQLEFPHLTIWHLSYNYGDIAIMLVTSYIFGHVIAFISGSIEKNKIKWIRLILNNNKPRQVAATDMELNGRIFPVVFRRELGEAIIQAASDFYGINVNPSDKDLFSLIYSPIYNRMEKRDTFLALANMMRSLTIVFFFSVIYLLAKIMYFLIYYNFGKASSIVLFLHNVKSISTLFLLLLFTVILFINFRKGYQRNKYYSETIPYAAFLAWYKEKKLS